MPEETEKSWVEMREHTHDFVKLFAKRQFRDIEKENCIIEIKSIIEAFF